MLLETINIGLHPVLKNMFMITFFLKVNGDLGFSKSKYLMSDIWILI